MLRIDTPQAGYFKRRFIRGGPWVAVRLWHGAPRDPYTGEELERSHRWLAEVDGKLVDDEMNVLDTWIGCAGNPITETEYRSMLNKSGDAIYSAPESPEANPHRRADLRTMPPIVPPRR